MTIINKKLELTTDFVIEKAADDSSTEELRIRGFANTTTKDRAGDVIPEDTWKSPSALTNYKKNPIILAFHNHSKPIGMAENLSISGKGLEITAKISKAAGDIYGLIKDGVLKAFSVGFIVKDADYDSKTDIFVVKDLELLEISVVSVPMNQDSLFSLAKAFDNEEDYLEFKKSFIKQEESVKAESTSEEVTEKSTDSSESVSEDSKGNLNMDEKQLQELIAAAAEKAAASAAEKAAINAAEKAATSAIELGKTGAEKLLEEVEKRFAEKEQVNLKAVDDLRAELAEKATEIEALRKSKMQFDEKQTEGKITYAEKEAAVLLSKATGKAITDTKAFQNLVQKYGAHVPSATWELEVSTNMQDEIRRQLVVAPIFSKMINMNGPVMRIPVNPEAGYATWVLEAGYKAATSSGTAQDHVLKEINLTAYKLATKEFLGVEEDDDSIIPLIPVIRDAMVRRQAKAWDKALLLGAGAGADPIKGLTTTASAITETVEVLPTAAATVTDMIALRRKLGTRGLNPSELVYIVSNEVYFDLLEDTAFQTVDKVGPSATLLTGQVGAIGNTPVLVSGEFVAKADGEFGAIVVNQNNFLVGNYRGLRVESDYQVEYQQRLLVATQRVGFQQISSVQGNGIANFLWTT